MSKKRRRPTGKSFKRPPPRFATADEVFRMIELSESAMRKLAIGDDLTDAEVSALFESDYVKKEVSTPEVQPRLTTTLYEAPGEPSLVQIQDVEREMIAYFARHPEQMRLIPPRKFEELVAAIFRNNGFEVTLTPESRDGGVDIFAVQKSVFGGDMLHLIECKRYGPENTVGIGIVQRLIGVVEQHRATRGIIVTTSTFTRDAHAVRETMPHRLGFGAYTDLTEWVLGVHRRNGG